MTLQELGHIDELIAWLDNEQDGAEDAGFVARSATDWYPALITLRSEYATMLAGASRADAARAGDLEDAFRMGFRASEYMNDVDVDINAEGKAVAKWIEERDVEA